MRIEYQVRALANIDEIERYLQSRNVESAHIVLHSIYQSIRFIAEAPRGSRRVDGRDLRVKVIRRYRYKIFYRVVGDAVRIVHIRHTSRWPWPKD